MCTGRALVLLQKKNLENIIITIIQKLLTIIVNLIKARSLDCVLTQLPSWQVGEQCEERLHGKVFSLAIG